MIRQSISQNLLPTLLRTSTYVLREVKLNSLLYLASCYRSGALEMILMWKVLAGDFCTYILVR